MSAMYSLLRKVARTTGTAVSYPQLQFQPAGLLYRSYTLLSPARSALPREFASGQLNHFGRPQILSNSFSSSASALASRAPRPKARVVKEQKIMSLRSTSKRLDQRKRPSTSFSPSSSSSSSPSSSSSSNPRQWRKEEFPQRKEEFSRRSERLPPRSEGFSRRSEGFSRRKEESPRYRGSTSVSVTSFEKGSRNPQLEHSFAPGFASAYQRTRAQLRGAPNRTGNAGRDKAAAAEQSLIDAGGKRKSRGPQVRGFVPVRFALKPIASDVKLAPKAGVGLSKFKSYAATQTGTIGKDQRSESGVFADTSASSGKNLKDIMDQVAKSRFETMGLHPEVLRGVQAFLSTGTNPSKAQSATLNAKDGSKADPAQDLGDIKPTEIQALTIPSTIDHFKKSPYTLCAAETGSGKTLAYLIPALHDLKQQEDEAIQRFSASGAAVNAASTASGEDRHENEDGSEEDYESEEEAARMQALSTVRQYNQPRAIVLLPSRELVSQVAGILKQLSHTIRLRTLQISHSMTPKSISQRLSQAPVDIIVATPTSLLDYLGVDRPENTGDSNKLSGNTEDDKQLNEDGTPKKRRVSSAQLETHQISLESLRHLVIDEADTMFDRGFGTDVTKIVQQAKANNQRSQGKDVRNPTKITVVSATLPKRVSDTLDETLPGLLKITTPSLHKSLPGLHQTFLDLKPYFGNRPKAIIDVLAKQQQVRGLGALKRYENTLIFCNTKHSCELLHEHLTKSRVPGVVGVLHGEAKNREEILSQFTNDDFVPPAPPRPTPSPTSTTKPATLPLVFEEKLKQFASGRIRGGKILISTDIASRGIDTTVVNHVVLYDFPVTIIDYLHRVGRTARAGRGGRATSLVGRKDRNLAERIMVGIRTGQVLS